MQHQVNSGAFRENWSSGRKKDGMIMQKDSKKKKMFCKIIWWKMKMLYKIIVQKLYPCIMHSDSTDTFQVGLKTFGTNTL